MLKVALTGGPCGGKTTSIKTIEEEFQERGYHVIVVPEAATILINSGIRPFGINGIPMYDFQRYVMELQLQLESHAEEAAKQIEANTIIVCDRGILDDKAYVSDEEFKALLKTFNTSKFDLFNRYDLIMHLVTAADGKKEYYTTENNKARTETPEQAIEKDKRTLEAWFGHDNLKIIGNDTEFSVKIARTVQEIYELLKSPYPIQKQEKYLINDIDIDKLLELNPILIDIEQYFKFSDDQEIIYRKSKTLHDSKYTKITKIDTETTKERIVTKKNITEEEYLDNIVSQKPIRKKRYCFSYLNQYFRLDIFDNELKILEIEETNKTKQRKIPNFIKIEDEVTTDINYRNSSLYKKQNNSNKEKKKR